MKEISLNILDVATNSITAGATKIEINVDVDLLGDTIKVTIDDNGCGMDKQFLAKICDPFTTTRTTRKVGLGIPLFMQSAKDTGGSFEIQSEKNRGTTVCARYVYSSIDRMPIGNLAETMTTLIMAKESVRYILKYSVDGNSFIFDTDEVKQILSDVLLYCAEVQSFLKQYISQQIDETNGKNQVI